MAGGSTPESAVIPSGALGPRSSAPTAQLPTLLEASPTGMRSPPDRKATSPRRRSVSEPNSPLKKAASDPDSPCPKATPEHNSPRSATPDMPMESCGSRFRSAPSQLARAGSETSEMRNKARATRAGFKRPSVWVLLFGWTLAICAGLVNVTAFRSWGLYVSHMTGTTSRIGMSLEGYHAGRHAFDALGVSLSIVFSFIIGAFTCGMLIDKTHVRFGGKSFYGLALIGNAVLLVIAVFDDTPQTAACCAAAACGLQNAMCTSHFGAVVRTTHVTGTVTDMGSTMGRMAMIYLRKGCRRSRLNVLERAEVGVDARKLLVLGPMWICYLLGSMAGAYLETHWGVKAMLLPAALTASLGLLYMLFRQKLKEFFKAVQKETLDNSMEYLQATLMRTQQYFAEAKQRGEAEPSGGLSQQQELVIEMEGAMDDIMETMKNFEENVQRLCTSPDPPHQKNKLPPRASTTLF